MIAGEGHAKFIEVDGALEAAFGDLIIVATEKDRVSRLNTMAAEGENQTIIAAACRAPPPCDDGLPHLVDRSARNKPFSALDTRMGVGRRFVFGQQQLLLG